MAAKRRAGRQLTQENWDDAEDPEEPKEEVRASGEVLAHRVIRTARRRAVPHETEKRGIFSSFGGFGKPAAEPSNAFGFISSLANGSASNFLTPTTTNTPSTAISSIIPSFNTKPTEFTITKPPETKISNVVTPVSTKSSLSIVTPTNTKDSTDKKPVEDPKEKSEYYINLKSLNRSVSEWIKSHVDKNPLCILTPIFDDYTKYLKELEKIKPAVENASKPRIENKIEERIDSSIASSTPKLVDSSIISPTNKLVDSSIISPTNKLVDSSIISPTNKLIDSSITSLTNKRVDSSITLPTNERFNLSESVPSATKNETTLPTTPKSDEKNTIPIGLFDKKFSSTPVTQAPTFSFGIRAPTPTFSINAPTTSTFSFGIVKPFTPIGSPSTETKPTEEDNDEDGLPKVAFTPVVEEDSVYSKRCKVFVKKNDTFGDRGVGTLYLKPIRDSEKYQLIVRAETSLGNLLVNIVLTESIPIQRMGKNNVMLVCVPNTNEKPPPVPTLLRVKSAEEADELLETLNKHKK